MEIWYKQNPAQIDSLLCLCKNNSKLIYPPFNNSRPQTTKAFGIHLWGKNELMATLVNIAL